MRLPEVDGGTISAALASGVVIGLILGLVGGGGSILAVPLLVHAVGVQSPHLAIGTAAMGVAVNAASSLAGHVRARNVKWRCGLVFAAAGAAGAALGAEAGKALDGSRLLILFGLLMVGVGLAMSRRRGGTAEPDVRLTRETARHLLLRLLPAGFLVGLLSGFFGIGGGFLIVPALIFSAGLGLRHAIGTSLVVITALGLTTAASYALAGLVDWGLVGLLVLGGAVGSVIGVRAGVLLSRRKRALELAFAALVVVMGLYVTVKAAGLV